MTCICGHSGSGHDDTGHCLGDCYDDELDSTYRCLCHAYRRQTVAEQLDAAQSGKEFGQVLMGLLTALDEARTQQ